MNKKVPNTFNSLFEENGISFPDGSYPDAKSEVCHSIAGHAQKTPLVLADVFDAIPSCKKGSRRILLTPQPFPFG